MDTEVQGRSIDGAVAGHIVVGRYVLQIGEACGAVLREASAAERSQIRARHTPVFVRPRLVRGLLDRDAELAAALSALHAGLPVELSGERGIGKTAFLRHLAHHPRAAVFADGIVYLSAWHQSFVDLAQLIFDAFYESDQVCKPTDTEIRRGLQEKHALILLDDVQLPGHELEQLFDIAPQSAFAVATRERCLWSEVRNVALSGLRVDDSVLLLERALERSFDAAERSVAERLCTSTEGHPRRILQAAALVRERGNSLYAFPRDITAESLITELMASIDDKQRRTLLALTALPGMSVRVQHIAGIAEVVDIEPSLMALVRRGLVAGGQSRYRLATGVTDRIRRTEDLNPWVNRAVTYFTAWAERNRRSADNLLEESEVLLRLQQHATDIRRWGEVLQLGRLLEGALIVGARWGAWGISLERCLAAARAVENRSAEAWALHELGTRAACLGEHGKARASLGQAVKQRKALKDDAAAAASQRNLALVLTPALNEPAAGSALQLDDVRDSGQLPLRTGAPQTTWAAARVPAKTSFVGLALTASLCAALGWFGYLALAARLDRTVSSPQSSPQSATAKGETTPHEPSPAALYSEFEAPAAEPQAPPRILIFTSRPGAIATSGPTRLCYAVSNAVQVRVEPGIGEVEPSSTLTCRRIVPARTTTYELTASGRDGHQVSQQLVIVVK